MRHLKPNYPLLSTILVTLGLLSACGHDNSAQGVANEFLFRYFIELNQRSALELSTGLAQDKLEEEIELTQSVRMTPNLDLAQHKPFLDYELVKTQQRDENSLTLFYDVTIESPEGADIKREIVLTTVRLDGVWKVSNFDTYVD
ncbi:MAG: hypothetical protein ACE5IY_14100 [bacterium]